MIEPPFPQSLGIQVLWLLQELKERQPALLEFVKHYMECFPCTSMEQILFAGLAPHLHEETTMLTIRIPPKCITQVQNAHLMTPKDWKMALRELKRKLQDRNVHQTSRRTMVHENITRNFFKQNFPIVQRDKRHAEILFLAIWEMEALSLDSEGKTITP